MSFYGKLNFPAQAETHSGSAAQTTETPQLQPSGSALPHEHHMHRKKKSVAGVVEQKSLWNGQIVWQAIIDSFLKLNPRGMVKNPVMFVVEVGSVLTTALLIDNAVHNRPGF